MGDGPRSLAEGVIVLLSLSTGLDLSLSEGLRRTVWPHQIH
jgi:hypothetical protein